MGNAPSSQDPSPGKRRHGSDAAGLHLSPSFGNRNLLAMSQGPPLSRRASSFLDEPVESKRTERGEDEIRLPVSGGGGDPDWAAAAPSYSPVREPAPGSGRLRYAVSEMQGWRSHMEDEHVLSPPFSADPRAGRVSEVLGDHHLFAVFDGHGEFFLGVGGERRWSLMSIETGRDGAGLVRKELKPRPLRGGIMKAREVSFSN